MAVIGAQAPASPSSQLQALQKPGAVKQTLEGLVWVVRVLRLWDLESGMSEKLLNQWAWVLLEAGAQPGRGNVGASRLQEESREGPKGNRGPRFLLSP